MDDNASIDAYQASREDFVDGQLIYTHDLSDNAANGGNGLTFNVQDGKGGVTIVHKAVQGVRPNGGAFPSGEDQHLTGYALTFELVPTLDHHPGIGVDAAEK